MNGSVFISYRREDSAYAAVALYKHLLNHFGSGRVFMDVDTIKPGVDFVKVLEDAVGACEALIVIIGPRWLSASGENGRRLDNPQDFVRLEVGSALRRNVRVIPVLLNGAEMPRIDSLPRDLQPLVRRNAVELRNTRFDADMERLVEALHEILDTGADEGGSGPGRRRMAWAGTAVIAAAVVAAVLMMKPWVGPTAEAGDGSGAVDTTALAADVGPGDRPDSDASSRGARRAVETVDRSQALEAVPGAEAVLDAPTDEPPGPAADGTATTDRDGPDREALAADMVRRIAVEDFESLAAASLAAKLDSLRTLVRDTRVEAGLRARAALVGGQIAFLVPSEEPDAWNRTACATAPDPRVPPFRDLCRRYRPEGD